MTAALIAFLTAQLDDDEQTALALDDTALNGVDSTAGMDARVYLERIRAEVDAKRRMLAWLERTADWASGNDLWNYPGAQALAIMALPYGDRPGFDPQWAIEAAQ